MTTCIASILVVLLFGLGAGPLQAQPAPPAPSGPSAESPAESPAKTPAEASTPPVSPQAKAQTSAFEARIQETADSLANYGRLKRLSSKDRHALVEFVFGNTLFVATHELGHAAVSELDLPVLGREEDAADDFAILTMLRVVGTDFSDRVLTQATRGWFLSAKRSRKEGDKPDYYQRHGLDEQRAYQIVCMAVGSNPEKYKYVAELTKLPEDRQRSCGWDFDTATRSWTRVVAPHLRKPEQPKVQIDIIYGEATGELEVFATSFKNTRFLEVLAAFAADRFAWPKPMTFEMRTCGDVGARWTIDTRRLHICYELAEEFSQLYYRYGRQGMPTKKVADKKSRPPASARSQANR